MAGGAPCYEWGERMWFSVFFADCYGKKINLKNGLPARQRLREFPWLPRLCQVLCFLQSRWETISVATSNIQALPRSCSPIPRTWWGRMKLLGAVLLAASLLVTASWGEQHPWPDEPSQTCFFQMLSSVDSEFCRGDLEIIYPELGDVGCTYIPKCHRYRQRISREWGSPRVRYPWAEKGADLRNGDVKGHVLTDYVRPTPPPRSGYHRYQLRLYEQPAHADIALSPEERVSLGAWAMESFVEQFRLGSPVASTQFLTKYYED
ncbi:phosphatidylethanolamine-binding protein 4 isoform X2 [Phalacrocorax carbo]|uniref:phosphatidylethanolamine-binding protein 4 isoform X2 n=1 Tax=Phalacrocorax carbo TaxID=9209 RepID=UPI003119C1CB